MSAFSRFIDGPENAPYEDETDETDTTQEMPSADDPDEEDENENEDENVTPSNRAA